MVAPGVMLGSSAARILVFSLLVSDDDKVRSTVISARPRGGGAYIGLETDFSIAENTTDFIT